MELELLEELVVYNSEMPYGRALLSAYRAVCHYSGIVSGSLRFRDFMIYGSYCGGGHLGLFLLASDNCSVAGISTQTN